MSSDVCTSAFLVTEIVFLFESINLLVSRLILMINLLLSLGLAAITLVLPTLQKDVIPEELISLIKL